MKYTLLLCILVCSITFTGCTLFSLNDQKKSFAPQQQPRLAPQRVLVHIGHITDSPILPDSRPQHKGYGGAFAKDLFRTAKHLVTGEYDRLVITNQSGSVCPLQNIWTHPYVDLALVKTTNDCFPAVFIPPYPPTITLPKQLIYIDEKEKKTMYSNRTADTILLDKVLLPGMSGGPVRGTNNTIIGVISAQQASGTMVILLTEKLLSYRQDVLSEGGVVSY